jgi:hypothetical protein
MVASYCRGCVNLLMIFERVIREGGNGRPPTARASGLIEIQRHTEER